MKIAVCVKHVPDGRQRILPDTKRLDRSGPGELNDADKNAIEEALRIQGELGAELVVLAMGPESAVDSLRTALALGADRAVLISDPALVGSDLVATSTVLAKALEREQADLVFFGQQTSDGGGGLLWAAVADRLRRPFVSQATELSLDGTTVRVTRQTEVGDDVIEMQLPAMVAVSDAINEPRYTSLKGRMGAKKKPLDVVTLSGLGLGAGDAASLTEVIGIAEPPARVNSVKVDDEANASKAILEFLVEKQLV